MKRDAVSTLLENEDELRQIEAAKHVASARHLLTCFCDRSGGRTNGQNWMGDYQTGDRTEHFDH